ncbi:MAG: prepilin-type N-terminal cleavage/methylation domain-containing protein [Nitrospira sp.]|nr:prepilin-type N-terminal cleavage/methylation domain-containing protein [Nitrospira sp.]
MRQTLKSDGISMVEVMVAMMISGIALMGTLGAVEISSRHAQQSVMNSQALELAQGRLEVKRSIRWQLLLEDDLDRDIADSRRTAGSMGL